MKKISLILSAILLASTSYGQAPGGNPPFESWSQMWLPGSTYYNVPTAATLGVQKDTSAGTLNLVTSTFYTSKVFKGQVATDTVIASPLSGNCKISFTAYVWKGQKVTTTVNPVVQCKLQKSNDNINWFDVVGATVFTLTPTSGTQASGKNCSWDLADKQGRFWRGNFSVTVDTAVIQMGYLRQDFYEIER